MTAKEFNKNIRDLFNLVNGAFAAAANYLKPENYNVYYTNIAIDEDGDEEEARYSINISFSFYFNDRNIKKANVTIDDRNLNPQFIAGLIIGTVYAEDFYQGDAE